MINPEQYARKLSSFKTIAVNHKTDNSSKKGLFKSNTVSDADFNYLKYLFHKLRVGDKTFSEYKRHFNKMCQMCNIPNTDCIIISEKFVKGESNKNTVEISYSNNTKKIIIPTGYMLYHRSPYHNMHELTPTFRGKSGKGYLYSSPRVYFSIRKLPKICADIDHKQKTTWYIPVTEIKVANIDPLLPNFAQGAVYVDTSFPIRLQNLTEYKEKTDMMKKESTEPNFQSLEEFMEFYDLRYANEDVYNESLSARIGEIFRKHSDKRFVESKWKNEQKKLNSGWKQITIPKKIEDELRGVWGIATKTTSYSIYKSAFKKVLSYFGISANGTVINRLQYDGKDKTGTLSNYSIQTHSGDRKIVIPNGTLLIHQSTVPNITILKPSFRSRTHGRFLYPDQRVYFSLGKPISPKKAGLENQKTYKYTPKETIQTAYIDPAASDFNTGAIYLTSSSGIPVISLEKKSEDINKKI